MAMPCHAMRNLRSILHVLGTMCKGNPMGGNIHATEREAFCFKVLNQRGEMVKALLLFFPIENAKKLTGNIERKRQRTERHI